MASTVKIVGIAGSLRAHSTNAGLLRAAAQLLPPETELEIVSLHGIPPFNEDEETDPVPAVRTLKAKVRAADAILFAAPEYNYGVTGVLKNALDYGSRPPGDNVWKGKPVAMVGASAGMFGTARAQYQLRQTFVSLEMFALGKPEVMISFNTTKFDEEGNLTDAAVRKQVGELVAALVAWTRRLRGEPTALPPR